MEDIKLINCNCNFINGPLIEVLDEHSENYIIEFYERLGDEWGLIFTNHTFKPFTWFRHLRKFRTKWRIKVWGIENEKPVLLFQHTYDENNKKILLRFDSPVFQTHLTWLFKTNKFSESFNCKIIIESKFKDRLEKSYKTNCEFIEKINDLNQFCEENEIYASYKIGRSDIQSNTWNFWESNGIFENHTQHHDSWDHPSDWIKFRDEDLFENILAL